VTISQHVRRGKNDPGAKRVLVTGGAGFIGANLVRLFLERCYEVTVLDNLSAGREEYLNGLPVRFLAADILDREAVERAVLGQAGIVHLAAQTGVPGSLADPRQDCEVNIVGTLTLLEACRTEQARVANSWNGAPPAIPRGPRFIFASSNAPLGRQTPPATEAKAPLPVSPYGASKLAGEAYCLAYQGSWGLETVALRCGNVYGPFSAHKNSVVAKFCKDVLATGKVTLDGDGEQTRDFIYVGDLCKAILLAFESRVSGEVFQIATGIETSIRELALMAQQATTRNVELLSGPARRGDVRRNYSSVDKARTLLGWEPQTRLLEGLRATWQWFQSYGASQTTPRDSHAMASRVSH
jgi:UDP-glucose 4-epimerase